MERKINKTMCEDYIIQLKQHLLIKYSSRTALALIIKYEYNDLSTMFFTDVATRIKQSITPQTEMTNEILLNIFESTLTKNNTQTSKTQIPQLVPYYPTFQQICVVNPIPIPNCFSMPIVTISPSIQVGYTSLPFVGSHAAQNGNTIHT